MLTNKELQERTGYSKRMIEFITQGRHTPHPKKAKVLEAATGVPRLAWLYPEEFSNPYVPAVPKGARIGKDGE